MQRFTEISDGWVGESKVWSLTKVFVLNLDTAVEFLFADRFMTACAILGGKEGRSFADGKQALFEKDERLIFKRFEKICLLSKQISMKTSLWDLSSLFKINKSRNGTFNFVPTTSTLFALRVLFVLEVSSLVPFIFLVQVRVGGNSSIF